MTEQTNEQPDASQQPGESVESPEEQAGDQDAGPASTPPEVPGEDVTEGGDEPVE